MPTRFLLAGLQYFAASVAVALMIVLLAPAGAIRFFGFVALASAAAGFALDVYALRDADPHAFMVLRFRLAGAAERVRAIFIRARAAITHAVAAKVPHPAP